MPINGVNVTGYQAPLHDVIVDDDTPSDRLFNPTIDGEVKAHGLVPRQHSIYPPEMFAPPTQIKIIDRSNWSAMIKEKNERKRNISDILLEQNIPSMDQGQNGYCWGHSTVGSLQAQRALSNQPYIPLSAYMVCAIIKKGRNEGGWCGLSAKFLRDVGVCSQVLWPQGKRNLSLDTPEARADAAKRKVTEDWVDLTRDIYDQNLTFDMVATLLLMNVPVAGDFNWWSHSVMLCDLVEVEAGSFGIRLRNSWTDSYGDRGFSVLRGNKARPDGAIAIRVSGGLALAAWGDFLCGRQQVR